VREAGLEVAVPNFVNFLVSNHVINSSEPGILCITQSIDFMLCDSVKGQKCGQKRSLCLVRILLGEKCFNTHLISRPSK